MRKILLATLAAAAVFAAVPASAQIYLGAGRHGPGIVVSPFGLGVGPGYGYGYGYGDNYGYACPLVKQSYVYKGRVRYRWVRACY
jgi:hypothetical protein